MNMLLTNFGFIQYLLHGNIDQTFVNSLHCLLNVELCGLDCHVITTEYTKRGPLNTHVTPIL